MTVKDVLQDVMKGSKFFICCSLVAPSCAFGA
jgi:hypothetical protein